LKCGRALSGLFNQPPSTMQLPDIENLIRLSDYHQFRQHIFPSATSLHWFLRKHKEHLVQHGALLMLNGRWLASPDKFDAYLAKVGTLAATRQLTSSGEL
jgi:hypothetical protein